MSKLLSENYYLLQVLAKNKSKSVCKLIIRTASSSLVKAISEICYNLIKNTIIPLNESEKKFFKKKAKLLNALATRRTSIGEKRKLVQEQTGAVLSKILTPSLKFFRSLLE